MPQDTFKYGLSNGGLAETLWNISETCLGMAKYRRLKCIIFFTSLNQVRFTVRFLSLNFNMIMSIGCVFNETYNEVPESEMEREMKALVFKSLGEEMKLA